MNTKVMVSKWLGVVVLVALAALFSAGAVSAMVDITPARSAEAFDNSWTRFTAYLQPSVGQLPSGGAAASYSGNSWDRFVIYLQGSGQMPVTSTQDSWAAFQAYYWASTGHGTPELATSGKPALASMGRPSGDSWSRFEQYLIGSGVAK